jgi:hypothetical protein
MFDLETTDFLKDKHDIIEIYEILLNSNNGAFLGDTEDLVEIYSLVKPPTTISQLISEIIGINNEPFADAPSFHSVGSSFKRCTTKKIFRCDYEVVGGWRILEGIIIGEGHSVDSDDGSRISDTILVARIMTRH